MNAAELSRLMAERASDIAQYLLPAGKKAGVEWKAGSTSGEAGRSLSVRITGAKAGVWRDFASDEGGDLLDLWARVRGVSTAEAMRNAKAYLGVRDTMPPRERKPCRRPATLDSKPARGAVAKWLGTRGLTPATIAAYRVSEQARDGKAFAVFPYLRDGELVNAKYRDIADKRGMRQEKDAEPCLFGWHLIDPRARSVCITEGEIDAMTLHQVGFPALSVNAGAGNHQWIENDWDRLERFSEILLCFDDDEAGHKGAREVAHRLGIERCRLVTFGAKDANQWLQDGAERADFDDAMQRAEVLDPEELVSAAVFMGQVKALFWPDHSAPTAPRLAFGKHECDWFEFRPGEYTIWTGINGHGKTLMQGYAMLSLMHQGERVCVFSGEMQPARLLKRYVKQATGIDRPTAAYIDAVAQWLTDRMWVFNVIGSATIDRLLEVFRYAAKRFGIRHFVIDSLMMTDVPEDGAGAYSAQKEAVQKIANFAKKHGVHVHLIAHPRKANDESKAPGKLDVSGSSRITDAADNVFSVWSARKEENQEDDGKPDALLELHKQRNGDVQHFRLWLWFNRACQQYSTGSQRRPVTFVRFEPEGAESSASDSDNRAKA
jgi:twinkle protein